MLLTIFLALFLPCAGMSVVFMVYLCMLWYAASHMPGDPVKRAVKKGLSVAELEKLPKVTGDKLVHGNECAICLDEIEGDQPARLVPGCNHGFHLQCADNWLSNQPVCPVCRAKLGPDFFDSVQNPC
ncbi:hypothetical protein RND81_03G008600 [Saponaria officinalis]|uniref:RING-type domain-containing protein n=1 Tax=Saponaria officinalis TaxID=3572 RepID=A0AAW1LXP0_SAPOF